MQTQAISMRANNYTHVQAYIMALKFTIATSAIYRTTVRPTSKFGVEAQTMK